MSAVLFGFVVFLLVYFRNTIKFLWTFYRLDIPTPKGAYPIVGHALQIIGLNEEGE